MDRGAPAGLDRAVRQARRAPARPPGRPGRQPGGHMSNEQTAPGELDFTRVFDAPRELVFSCMIDPAHLAHFWGPAGTSAPAERIHVDPRPGGVFETVMVNDADGSEYPTRATYLEVTEPERLVWREAHRGMGGTATFTRGGPGPT